MYQLKAKPLSKYAKIQVMTLEEVYSKHVNGVYRFFYARLGEKCIAEDLTSQTFEKVVQKFEVYDQTKGAVSTWVYTIARNCLIDYFRSKAANNTRNSVQIEDDEDFSLPQTNERNKDMDNYVQLHIEKEILNDVLAELDEEENVLIHLRYTQEYSYGEIAKALDMNVNTVGIKLHRAHKKLKEIMISKGLDQKIYID